jgi:hypothetical protein
MADSVLLYKSIYPLLLHQPELFIRGSQSSQLNDEPRNYFLRRGPKTDKVGH